MAIKNYTTQAGKNGSQKSYKNGGQDDTITATNDGSSGFGHIISGGGGDDTIFGSDYAGPGNGTGDPKTESGDLLIGGSGSDYIVGGGGDDWIYGGKVNGSDGAKGKDATATNTLFGDERGVFLNDGNFTGGDDVLTAGDDSMNFMFGDVQSVNNGSGTFVGGNDRLIGGENSTDVMFGDWSSIGGGPIPEEQLKGGEDTFVIKQDGGSDTIGDFRSTDTDGDASNGIGDKVELNGFDLTYDTDGDGTFDFDDLNFSTSGFNQILTFDANNTVTFLFDDPGYSFTADDFVFV